MINIPSQQEIKFIADCMLGKLVKWLRIFGYDTTYITCSTDSFLILSARKDNRILLTRDTHLIQKRNICNFFFVKSDHWD